jgi:regulator of protease activity HflC (stomatin/prohibitin superfamily)
MAKITVMEYQRAVRYRDGRMTGVLEPGRHGYWPFWRFRHEVVDLRSRLTTVPGQELLTSDGVTVRVSLLARWRVTDAVAFVQASASPVDTVYATVQLALRGQVGSRDIETLLANRGDLDAQLAAACGPQLTPFGMELEQLAVRDVMFPGELKQVFAQVATAKQNAHAALERARGESAALRSLANSARVLDSSPALLHLRTLQAAVDSGATIVITAQPSP